MSDMDHATAPTDAVPLPRSIRIGWALGQLPIASHVGLVSFYLLYFVTDVHHIPPAWAGVALLLPRLFNIVFDPVMGALSDRTRTRFGRRRPYLLGGSLTWGLAIMILFGVPLGADAMRGAAILFAAFMAVSIGQTLYHVPYSAMLAEMTRDESERISLAAWKEGVSRVGILIAAMTVPLVVALYPNELAGYRVSGMVFGAVIIGGGLVAFFATAHAPATPYGIERIALVEQVRAVAGNRPFLMLVAAYSLIMIADEIFSGALIFYAINVLGETAAFVGKAYPISSIAAIAAIPLWNALARRIGMRAALVVALIGMAGSWLAVLAIPAGRAWLMLPLMGIGGAFNAGMLMLPAALMPDTVDYDARRTGQRREGMLYGAWIFCQQTAMALGGFVLSMALTVIGYHAGAGAQPPAVHNGLAVVIAVLPAGLALLAIILVCAYPLRSANAGGVRAERLDPAGR